MPRYSVVKDFQRPPAELIKQAAEVEVMISFAQFLGPRQIMDSRVKPLRSDYRICGPALTIRPESVHDRFMARVGLMHAKPGDVIVLDAGGTDDHIVWGGGLTMTAQLMGCAGIVVDGACEAGKLLTEFFEVPVFCRGLSTRLTGEAKGPGWVNGPVISGGVIVNPGDLIVGDWDGVVVIPKDRIAEVVPQAYESDQAIKRIRDNPDMAPVFSSEPIQQMLNEMKDIEIV